MLYTIRVALPIALFLLALACQTATAATLADYRQTPFGSSRDEVIKQLRRTAGPVIKSEHTDSLSASLGVISTRDWRYALKGTYRFHRGRLYRIDIRPIAENGGGIPRHKLAEVYRDLVGHHREEYGPPRFEGKCGGGAPCRRAEWLLDHGKSMLTISEVLDPERAYVEISRCSVAVMEEIAKSEERGRSSRQERRSGKKAF